MRSAHGDERHFSATSGVHTQVPGDTRYRRYEGDAIHADEQRGFDPAGSEVWKRESLRRRLVSIVTRPSIEGDEPVIDEHDHSDAEGRVAVYGVESPEYKCFAEQVKASKL